jgi:hypothetical protein
VASALFKPRQRSFVAECTVLPSQKSHVGTKHKDYLRTAKNVLAEHKQVARHEKEVPHLAPMTTLLRYRGLPYEKAAHEKPSSRPVEHTYRGNHYLAPLLHEVTPSHPSPDALCYRGRSYVSHR